MTDERKNNSVDEDWDSASLAYSEYCRNLSLKEKSKGVRPVYEYVLMGMVALLLAVGLPYSIYHAYTIFDSSDYFKVKHIEVRGNHNLDSDYILGRADLSKGINIFDVGREKMEEALASDPWVASVKVETSLPDSVLVTVVEHTPAALLVNGTDWSIIDPNGYVIKRYEPTDPTSDLLKLPLISGLTSSELNNEAFRKLVVSAIDVAHLYGKFALSPDERLSEIHADPVLGLTLITNSGLRIRLGVNHFSERLKRVAIVRKNLHQTNHHADYILADQRDNLNRITVGSDLSK